jgi:citrate synthase
MPISAAFRAAVASLRPESGLRDEVVLTGAMPVLAAALVRRSQDWSPLFRTRPSVTRPTRYACCAAK